MSGVLRLGLVAVAVAIAQKGATPPISPTFHQDVEPILKKRCQSCHAPGEIGPMPLLTYSQVRPWAVAIRESVKLRSMPPWFADSRFGKFANDPRLTPEEIAVVDQWVASGAPEGASVPSRPTTSELRPAPRRADLVVTSPALFHLAANAVFDYQYLILPLRLNRDQWVRSVEVRPSNRAVVHHAVLYVREAGSDWLRGVPSGRFFAPKTETAKLASRTTKSDILAVYAPGTPAMVLPTGMAKKIPADSDLVLQLHYTSRKTAQTDQPAVVISVTDAAPAKRVITLQMGRDDLRIPPGEANFRATVSGTLPQDALLLSLFPHMHLRGVEFDFDVVGPHGQFEPLLRVAPYRFDWQLNYILETPRLIRAGTRLQWTGYYDNSPKNPSNPDPAAEVTWGEQSTDEMMIGFFDVAVDPRLSKADFFVR